MKIVETNLKFTNLSPIGTVTHIVLHHAASAGDLSAAQIHKMHLNNGWSGCGYHFVVRQNGTVERGRPENCSGAHVANQNKGKIGVCFPGNFEAGTIGKAQKDLGIELVKYLKKKYPNAKICRHSDLMATACPGKKFPFNEFKNLTGSNVSTPSANKPQGGKALWELCVQGPVVKMLQAYVGEKQDGLYGDKTHKKSPLLKKGSKNQAVAVAQKRLIDKGFSLPIYGADGSFGDEMFAAVKNFQKAMGLSADGIVGQNTWKQLMLK